MDKKLVIVFGGGLLIVIFLLYLILIKGTGVNDLAFNNLSSSSLGVSTTGGGSGIDTPVAPSESCAFGYGSWGGDQIHFTSEWYTTLDRAKAKALEECDKKVEQVKKEVKENLDRAQKECIDGGCHYSSKVDDKTSPCKIHVCTEQTNTQRCIYGFDANGNMNQTGTCMLAIDANRGWKCEAWDGSYRGEATCKKPPTVAVPPDQTGRE